MLAMSVDVRFLSAVVCLVFYPPGNRYQRNLLKYCLITPELLLLLVETSQKKFF